VIKTILNKYGNILSSLTGGGYNEYGYIFDICIYTAGSVHFFFFFFFFFLKNAFLHMVLASVKAASYKMYGICQWWKYYMSTLLVVFIFVIIIFCCLKNAIMQYSTRMETIYFFMLFFFFFVCMFYIRCYKYVCYVCYIILLLL
jgi:glucan phosphoethanolaminetransferase (alkaline phosphatase superfamily)